MDAMKRTLETANAACDHISQVAWNTRTFGKFQLQKLVYADVRSTFSNYGRSMTWMAAPGEGIVTLYPFNTYAATWGTSFSTPFVAGAAALLLDVQPVCTQSQAAQALAHARYISSDLGNGRLDLYSAVQAWRQALGMW